MHNEDSTLFSLDELTKGAAQATSSAPAPRTQNQPTRGQPQRDEDSGLIDLDELARKVDAPPTFSPYAPPPLRPFTARPPLGAPLEETTLSGMSAVQPSAQATVRWKVPALAALVLVAAVGFAFVFRSLLEPEPQVSAPAQTIVVLAPAPPPVEADLRPADRGATAAAASAPPVSEPSPSASRTKPYRPKHSTPPVSPPRPEPRQTDEPEPSKPPKANDPCARCGADLSCAMRCSVRGSG